MRSAETTQTVFFGGARKARHDLSKQSMDMDMDMDGGQRLGRGFIYSLSHRCHDYCAGRPFSIFLEVLVMVIGGPLGAETEDTLHWVARPSSSLDAERRTGLVEGDHSWAWALGVDDDAGGTIGANPRGRKGTRAKSKRLWIANVCDWTGMSSVLLPFFHVNIYIHTLLPPSSRPPPPLLLLLLLLLLLNSTLRINTNSLPGLQLPSRNRAPIPSSTQYSTARQAHAAISGLSARLPQAH